jgi:tripartite-type tricarboxylate transporter receptor subunit TctC
VFGSSGQGSNTTQHVMVLRDLLGLKARIVQGYKGTSDIALALERGEIEATCGVMVSTARLLMAPRIDSGDTRIFIQFGRKSVEDFRGAANIYDLLRDEEDKKVAEVVFRPDEAARAFAAPPGLPPERTQALRRAFDNAMRDPALLADADKQRLPIELMRGEEVAALFAAIYATPEKTVARAKAVMDVK